MAMAAARLATSTARAGDLLYVQIDDIRLSTRTGGQNLSAVLTACRNANAIGHNALGEYRVRFNGHVVPQNRLGDSGRWINLRRVPHHRAFNGRGRKRPGRTP